MAGISKLGIPDEPAGNLSERHGKAIECGQIAAGEPEAQPAREPRPLHEMLGCAAGLYASQGLDPVEFIRQLRDEWD